MQININKSLSLDNPFEYNILSNNYVYNIVPVLNVVLKSAAFPSYVQMQKDYNVRESKNYTPANGVNINFSLLSHKDVFVKNTCGY